MAQFTGPRHRPHGAPSPAESAGTPAADDGNWFDSSWELRKGLEVAELTGLPEGVFAPAAEPLLTPDASRR